MLFQTFGPYKVTTWDQMSAEMKERNEPALEHAHGIYVFFQEIGGRLVPLYVGQTSAHFGVRVAEHMNKERTELFKLDKKKDIHLLLIALSTPSGKPKRKASNTDMKTLDKLEFILIGACLLKNPGLRNQQFKKFHESLTVPGFTNGDSKDSNAASRALRALLKK